MKESLFTMLTWIQFVHHNILVCSCNLISLHCFWFSLISEPCLVTCFVFWFVNYGICGDYFSISQGQRWCFLDWKSHKSELILLPIWRSLQLKKNHALRNAIFLTWADLPRLLIDLASIRGTCRGSCSSQWEGKCSGGGLNKCGYWPMISGSHIIHGIKVILPLTSLSLLLVVSSLDQVSRALVSHVWSSVQLQYIENLTSWLQKSWTWEVSRFWELILGASPGQIVWIVWLNVGITSQCFQVCLSVCVPQVCNWLCWIGWNKAYQISCFDLYGSTQHASIPEPRSIATNECNRKSNLKVCANSVWSTAQCKYTAEQPVWPIGDHTVENTSDPLVFTPVKNMLWLTHQCYHILMRMFMLIDSLYEIWHETLIQSDMCFV